MLCQPPRHRGNERAEFVVNTIVDAAREGGVAIEQMLTTPYCNRFR